MKLLLKSSLIWLFSLYCLVVHAESQDPLWSKVIEQNKIMKHWLPKEIEQKTVIPKSGEPPLTIISKKLFEKIDRGVPIYKVISSHPDIKDAKIPDLGFEAQFERDEEAIVFSQNSKRKRTDGQNIDGKALVLYEVTGPESKVKLWVDGESGQIVRRMIEVSITLVADIAAVTNYGVNSEGNHVLQDTKVNMVVKIPFKKAHFEMVDKSLSWIRRP